jgi:hypothetical protein
MVEEELENSLLEIHRFQQPPRTSMRKPTHTVYVTAV